MVAHEDDEQCPLIIEITQAHHLTIDIPQVEIRRGRAQFPHRAGGLDHVPCSSL
jgi:hypothetical protein